MKKIRKLISVILAAAGLTLAAPSSSGQDPVIRSLGLNGRLICTDLQPGTAATVEWSSSVKGPWTNNWAGLESVTVDSAGMIQVNVPMFYRVRGTRPPSLAHVTFKKWVSAFPNRPGLVANLTGVSGGDSGIGTFTGEVLLLDSTPAVSHFVSFYHFTGPDHTFTALIDAVQTGSGPGSTATITGVITEGWMKGYALEGEFTQVAIDHDGGVGYEGSLKILEATPPSTLGQATFTKGVKTTQRQ